MPPKFLASPIYFRRLRTAKKAFKRMPFLMQNIPYFETLRLTAAANAAAPSSAAIAAGSGTGAVIPFAIRKPAELSSRFVMSLSSF